MVTRLEQNRWMLANGTCSLHADIIYTLQFGCRSPKQVLRCWLCCGSPKQVLRYWLCSSLLASLSITKTSPSLLALLFAIGFVVDHQNKLRFGTDPRGRRKLFYRLAGARAACGCAATSTPGIPAQGA